MTYSGKVINGTIVLDNDGKLPEGAEVRIEIEPPTNPRRNSPAAVLELAGTLTDEEAELIMQEVNRMRQFDRDQSR